MAEISKSPYAHKHAAKRIAMLSPVAWRTPPRKYGAWETVASNITEGLVKNGWDVTLFATKDSITQARLRAVVSHGYEENPSLDPKVCEYMHISEFFEQAHEFDLLHNHYDFMALTYSTFVKPPMLTTVHGFSSPQILPLYYKYSNVYYVSISDSDRDPNIDYLATVYNGIDLSLHYYYHRGGEDLVFLGRIHPDKGTHLACEVARKSGRRLLIGGIIQDREYFETRVQPFIDDRQIIYVGPVNPQERNELFSSAYALLHLNQLPERFGLVMAEANAGGIPVIAFDNGSCGEVIEDGVTGYLVSDVDDAVKALSRIPLIDRAECRKRVERYFSREAMVRSYEQVYDTIFERDKR
ncbi:MAG: glycosyltransferase family 4 protein [Chitinivibrionales bacterium]